MEQIYKLHLREDEFDVVILSLKAWTNVDTATDVLTRAEQLKRRIEMQHKAQEARDAYFCDVNEARRKDRSAALPFDEEPA